MTYSDERLLARAQTRRPKGLLPAETSIRSTITQIYEGTNQIQRTLLTAPERCGPRWAWDENIIAASWHALEEAVTYGLLRVGREPD